MVFEMLETRSNRRINHPSMAIIHFFRNPEEAKPRPKKAATSKSWIWSHAFAPERRAVSHAWGAQKRGGSIVRTISGLQNICQSIIGKLDKVKDKRWIILLIPD
jgi:hypothetical protein